MPWHDPGGEWDDDRPLSEIGGPSMQVPEGLEIGFHTARSQRGWVCPECERVYAPHITECPHCNGHHDCEDE